MGPPSREQSHAAELGKGGKLGKLGKLGKGGKEYKCRRHGQVWPDMAGQTLA